MKNLNKGLIAEITGLAIDIQNAGIGEVIYRISGAVGAMDIDVYIGGWEQGKDADLNVYIGLLGQPHYDSPEYAIEKLTEILTNHAIHA